MQHFSGRRKNVALPKIYHSSTILKGCISEEPCGGNLQARFCEGAYNRKVEMASTRRETPDYVLKERGE